MSQGWISLHRKIRDNWLFTEKRNFSKFEAWIDLLLEVNHEDNKFLLGQELVETKRGSTITSMRKLSEKWGWSITKVKNFLDLLQKDKMLCYKSDTKKTVLTIENYSLYQLSKNEKEHQSNTRVTREEHESNTKVTREETNNNDLIMNNNENNENKKQKIAVVADYEKIKKYWNTKDGLTQIRALSKTRKDKTKLRIGEVTEEEFYRAIDIISDSEFCTGNNNTGWKADFDWLISNDTNIVKVLEGKYNNKQENKDKKTNMTDDELMAMWQKKQNESFGSRMF